MLDKSTQFIDQLLVSITQPFTTTLLSNVGSAYQAQFQTFLEGIDRQDAASPEFFVMLWMEAYKLPPKYASPTEYILFEPSQTRLNEDQKYQFRLFCRAHIQCNDMLEAFYKLLYGMRGTQTEEAIQKTTFQYNDKQRLRVEPWELLSSLVTLYKTTQEVLAQDIPSSLDAIAKSALGNITSSIEYTLQRAILGAIAEILQDRFMFTDLARSIPKHIQYIRERKLLDFLNTQFIKGTGNRAERRAQSLLAMFLAEEKCAPEEKAETLNESSQPQPSAPPIEDQVEHEPIPQKTTLTPTPRSSAPIQDRLDHHEQKSAPRKQSCCSFLAHLFGRRTPPPADSLDKGLLGEDQPW